MAGTTALFIVLSVFSGIKDYSLSILDVDTPDIRISPAKGKTFLVDNLFIEKLQNTPDSIFYTKVLEERAFFKNKDKEEIAHIKGVDSLFNKVTPLDSLVMAGEWFAAKSTNACIVEYHLTRKLNLSVYTDLLQVYVPKAGKGYISNPNNAFTTIKPQVVGVISNQSQEEKKYVYVPLGLSQKLLTKANNEVSYIDIAIKNKKDGDNTIEYLKKNFPDYKISKREEINGSFYKILNSEKLIAYLVSLLVVVMVLSNTSGTIIMVIVDKKNDIKTLLNMGAPLKSVRRIFATYGFLLNILGMFVGLIIGVIIVHTQLHYDLIMMTPSIAYPIAFEWENIWVVCVTIILLGALASLLASGRISERFVKRR
ncbi:hypothetical protein GCM10011397_26830 [Wenyingzhuangia marina]|nr:hypothetical protein GCM10011397_26830 [Wenyingzhuangia marina]